jgi:hypothetical protein
VPSPNAHRACKWNKKGKKGYYVAFCFRNKHKNYAELFIVNGGGRDDEFRLGVTSARVPTIRKRV